MRANCHTYEQVGAQQEYRDHFSSAYRALDEQNAVEEDDEAAQILAGAQPKRSAYNQHGWCH